MASIALSRRTAALIVPVLVFAGCIVIAASYRFQLPGERLSLALLSDLVITAPLLYLLLIRNTSLSPWTALRVLMLGIIVAGFLLPEESGRGAVAALRRWLYPALEAGLVAFVVHRFVRAGKAARAAGGEADFLQQARSILSAVLGHAAAGRALASEVAVFYYAFRPNRKHTDNRTTRFTTYKGVGIRLVLGTFLCLFLIETAGMHFLFMLWSDTAAWILTGLSAYTCLQLFAHIRSLSQRSTVIADGHLYLRNGLMGGEAVIPLQFITAVEACTKEITAHDVQKLALIRGLEKHNTIIYLSEPVEVIKAFGICKKATTLLIHIDQQKSFMDALAPGLTGAEN